MLIGKRQPDHFELLFLNDTAQAAYRFFLLRRPQAVTLNETQEVAPRCFILVIASHRVGAKRRPMTGAAKPGAACPNCNAIPAFRFAPCGLRIVGQFLR